MSRNFTSLLSVLACATLLSPPSASAQDTQREDEADTMDIIVTGAMRVRQGGAQDIKHFRSVSQEVGMPRPEGLTVEGLMGEHDLTLVARRNCAQLFCLETEAMTASLPTRPDDRLFVGLGFTSNLDTATWHRDPLNLVAVVDQSGSMTGDPINRVRNSLLQIIGQMGPQDRVSIILYGSTSHIWLQPTTLAGNREAILNAVRAISIDGSTNMEAGLRLGYDTAFADAPGFKGNTRLMLFTDEQPNTGRIDADGFMGMAQAASKRGIGLTTIGVGVQFGDALAAQVSSVRGGNLFFIGSDADVKSVFDKQLDTMVSELAHDIRITMTPASGYKITAVFGVPGDTMTSAPDGAVTITVPTAFLSANGGGIFASLGKSRDREFLPAETLAGNAPPMTIALDYIDALHNMPGSDKVDVRAVSDTPSVPLRTAHLLVDEYLAMKAATTAFHIAGDPKEAHRLLSGLQARIEGSDIAGLEGEKRLTGDMLAQAALYSGYGGELPKKLQHLRAIGTWEITGVDNITDLRRGDRLFFTPDNELRTLRAKSGHGEAEESESYELNERQIHMLGSRLVFYYRASGDTMELTTADVGTPASIRLRRIEGVTME
jgi:Ca-activated chloride channel homolog